MGQRKLEFCLVSFFLSLILQDEMSELSLWTPVMQNQEETEGAKDRKLKTPLGAIFWRVEKKVLQRIALCE